MSKKSISVIITTYNRPNKLDNNIRLLLNQELSNEIKFSIIIVDDNSSVSNQNKVKSIANYSNLIKLIINPVNMGLSSSRNIGANQSKSDYLLFLDDDIMVDSFYVMGHLEVLMSGGRIATVGSLRFPKKLTDFNNLMKYLNSRELRQRNFDQKFLNDLSAQYFGGGICGVNRFDFISAGSFNESFKYYGGEDNAMGFSLKQMGVRICYAPKAKADHYDEVEIERYKVKFTEAGREGVKLILLIDSNFFDNSNFRFLLPISLKDNLLNKLIKIMLKFVLNSYLEKLLRNYLKLTNSTNFLFSKLLFHILFSCWMYQGLNSKSSTVESKVQYNN